MQNKLRFILHFQDDVGTKNLRDRSTHETGDRYLFRYDDFIVVHCFFMIIYLLFQNLCLSLQREIKRIAIMEIKKITHEEALARFKRSLEIKRNAEKRMAEEWRAMGLTGTIVSL